jgi:hypothetical protein
MPRTVILKEAQAPYTLPLEADTLGQETAILERAGRPVAVVVPFAEYEAFAAWRQRQKEEEEFWREQEEWEREWAKLPPWEQEGTWPDELTPEMIEACVQTVLSLRGISPVDDPDEALYIATSPELSLENIPLLLENAANLDEQL